jgi:hypothetical protein
MLKDEGGTKITTTIIMIHTIIGGLREETIQIG